jgi:branched-chain amino acid transport system substrate-binding protein
LRVSVAAGLWVGAATLLAACGGSSGSPTSKAASASSGNGSIPVTIGTSLSLSGDFAAEGQAFQRGYQLSVADQNAKGGLLGHPRRARGNWLDSGPR